MTSKIFGLGFVAATAAFGLLAVSASAQQPPPAPAAPVKVVPKAAPTPPPAVKAEVPAKVAPKAAVAKAVEPSPCKGLVETACKAKADVCGWIVPTKADAKTGAADKAYCRKVAGIAKKATPAAAAKADVKAAPAAKVIEKAAAPKVMPKAATPPPAAAK